MSNQFTVSDPVYGDIDTVNANDMVSINLGYDEAFQLAMNLMSGIHANTRQRDQRRGGSTDIGDVTIRTSFVARVQVRPSKDAAAPELPTPVAYSKRVADAVERLKRHYRSLPDNKLSDEQRCINDVLWILEGQPGMKSGPWPGDPDPHGNPDPHNHTDDVLHPATCPGCKAMQDRQAEVIAAAETRS